MKKIAIFASGSGTNAENIYKFFGRGKRISVPLIIYDRKDAGVASRMAPFQTELVYIPGSVWRERPEEILHLLELKEIDLIVLAGFLRMVPDCITEAYSGRIINIHPSLLPAYGGKGMYGHHVHEAVIANRETRSGVTVHYVTSECDAGEILMQEEVIVTPDDTPETLEAKIHPVEYSLYPRAIVAALTRIDLQSRISRLRDKNTTMQPVQDGVDTPPPVPAAQEWADKLGIKYDPDKAAPAYSAKPAAPAPDNGCQQPAACVSPVRPAEEGNGNAEGMPPTNLIWAVLVTILCCTIPGIIAIVMSSKVTSRYHAGDIEGARRASKATEWWVIISFILGILSATLYLPLSLLFN